MLNCVSPVYEVVSGQILLGQQKEFVRLHREVLLQLMRDADIQPFLCLFTELGRYARFLDIYQYPSLSEYGRRTDALLTDPRIDDYYARISKCIEGSIQVELAVEFTHLAGINAAV